MARQVGFGGDPERGGTERGNATPVTSQATSVRPDGAGGPKGRRFGKVMLTLFLIPMAGIGIAMVFRTLASGEWVGAAFAMVWSVVVLTMLVKRLLAALFAMPPSGE